MENKLKIGVVMPNDGTRPVFMEQARLLLQRQALRPDVLRIAHVLPKSLGGPDLVARYKAGARKCFEEGCDLVLCMENDDWYAPTYVQQFVNMWQFHGRPALCGVGHTVYYHIVTQRYINLEHSGRASMMCTGFTREVLPVLEAADNNDPYLDLYLWKQLRHKSVSFSLGSNILAIGIKHGFGKVAGGGHQIDWAKYNRQDRDFQVLEKIVGPDAGFYRAMSKFDKYLTYSNVFVRDDAAPEFNEDENCVLSIVTRKHGSKRPKGFEANQSSLLKIKIPEGACFEQVIVEDTLGLGMYAANCAFQFALPLIEGRWVYMVDDDDYMDNPEVLEDLQRIEREHNPDIIFCRMVILNGAFNNLYPSPQVWSTRAPQFAHIGTGCVIVRREVYKEYIRFFSKPRGGDFNMINEMCKNAGLKQHWHDKVYSRTGRVSRGKVEEILNT